GWGRLELSQGSDAGQLDQIESDLQKLEKAFADGLAPFGILAGDPNALDLLQTLAANQLIREPELKRVREEIARLAPEGLDAPRQAVAHLEKILAAAPDIELPSDQAELERLAQQLRQETDAAERSSAGIEKQIEALDREIDGTTGKATAKSAKPGLRQQESLAKETQFKASAQMESIRQELAKMHSLVEIDQAIQAAEAGLVRAQAELEATKLSEDEATISVRLDTAKEALLAHQASLTDTEREFNQIKGALSRSEGLHQKRAAAAAHVEELTRQIDHETLESDSYHRLYALFDECREKQLGTVMEPIHDRVVRWIRLLKIGDYQSLRFNDQFLPEKLTSRDGTIELDFDDESTGTIEQLGLMVRLALGSTLSKPEEPAVAILDDPLTHSDRDRLNLMRAVLKSAAAGDLDQTPPAGPLQILVFTCHPEWFKVEESTTVNLGDGNVLTRFG
ncbi:MAG: hypothetical protein K8T89_20695, partial [Planctomycetes bacterium]|nr:hypothetical protein [Planctomycetota bacterium]